MGRRHMLVLTAALLAGCAGRATLPVDAGTGPDPTIPPPDPSLIPAVSVAPARGWPAGVTPQAPPGFSVTAFATDLDHPRWLYVLPNGDVLVAETAAPPQPGRRRGLKSWIIKQFMKKVGAAVSSADRITLLRDADGDGRADLRTRFLTGLYSPFGIALVGDTLFVANTDAVVRVPYRDGATEITAEPEPVADLPAGPINQHWTKSLVASADGTRLYVGVGSASNIAEYGLEAERDRAAVLEVDPATGTRRVFASGLRNPVGLAWQPDSGALWTAVNERDELGSDVPPDYMTAIHDGDFFGWPFGYYGRVDERVEPARPDLVAAARTPDYALGPHTAPLGLAFYDGDAFPARYRHGAFVGLHGSWNRIPKSGYKVVFVPFADGAPAGPVEDFLTGFLDADENARGRPVGVAVGTDGALLVADDVGNAIWHVSRSRD